MGGVSFWFGIAKALLPLILKWLVAAQREGVMKEGERRLLGKQMVAYAEELGLWNEILTEVPLMSDDELRNILTGRVQARRGETEHPGQK